MKEELAKLVDLQVTDTNIRRLKRSIESAQERRASLEQEFEQHAFSIREIQKRRDDLNAERAANEAQIAENKTYLERADRNLKHAQNQKEYETAMREIDALQKQVTVHETKVVELMASVEEVETELSSRAEEINTLDSKRDEALAAFQLLSETEGIIPALESAHAIAQVVKTAPGMPGDSVIVVNLSGRGDKDVHTVAEVLKQRA